MKAAVLGAAQSAGAGNVPGGVKRLIEQWTQPKLDWRTLLQQQIESTIKSDFSFQKINRRSWHMDAVLPGMNNDEKIDVAIGIDMSGSISNSMARDFLSEVKVLWMLMKIIMLKYGALIHLCTMKKTLTQAMAKS